MAAILDRESDEVAQVRPFPARVAAKANEIDVVRLLLSLLVLPLYLLGVVAALVWLLLRWFAAAVVVGFADVTKRGADAG